jgi:hypothetical protein
MQTDAMERSQSERMAESAILDELMRAPAPAKDLKQRVGKRVFGLTTQQYQSGLDALVAAHKIHGRPRLSKAGKPTKTIDSYALGAPPPPPPSPRDLAPREILSILRSGTLKADLLKGRLKERLPGLSSKDYGSTLIELIAAREIHARYKRNKDGKPSKTAESYALGAPPPDEYVALVLARSKEMRAAAKAAGVKDAEFVAALVAGLALDGIGVSQTGSQSSDDGDRVLLAVRDLISREGSGALIPIRQLRRALDLTKARFDAALLELYGTDAIILHHHDYVGNLSTTERDELVADRYGNYYVGVALRGEG